MKQGKQWLQAMCKRKSFWWLVVNLVVLAGFMLAKNQRDWMNIFAWQISTPIGKAIGRISYIFPFSMMEVLYVGGAGVAMIVLARFCVVLICNKTNRVKRLFSGFLLIFNLVLSIYAGFWGLWGVQYYADGFTELSGLEAMGGTTEDLVAVTTYFVEQLQLTADTVARDEQGLFAESPADILAQVPYIYDWVETQYPFLAHDDQVPKAMVFSKLMSQMNFTGVYSPFTGEANLNMDSPTCLLPSTIAHELSHLRGIAPEDECNFLGVLVSTTSGIPAYEYSGYLAGYIYLANALYARDYEAWYDVASELPETVQLDLQNNTAYWAQYKTTTATVSQATYDVYLKSYQQTDGILSYGMAVNLLLAYYLPLIG